MSVITNDTADLSPQTTFDGPALRFDFPGFSVGVAEYAAGPTGCTVCVLPHSARTAIDICGGVPGTTGNYEASDAICIENAARRFRALGVLAADAVLSAVAHAPDA